MNIKLSDKINELKKNSNKLNCCIINVQIIDWRPFDHLMYSIMWFIIRDRRSSKPSLILGFWRHWVEIFPNFFREFRKISFSLKNCIILRNKIFVLIWNDKNIILNHFVEEFFENQKCIDIYFWLKIRKIINFPFRVCSFSY